VPLTTPDGSRLDGRDDIIFVTAGVILLSLLVQGPILPAVVRWARYPADHGEDEEFELAERAISGAAMTALDALAAEHGISDQVRDRVRREGYERLEFANAKAMARERALIDSEVGAMEDMLDSPDPLADGSVDLSSTADAGAGTTLQMVATSADVDLAQRSPLVRHEEFSRLKLAMLEHKREVLLDLRRSGTVDDLVVRRISANLDLEQVRMQGIEQLD
jgi:CPA1 family monovalent cation:H+ antiporter